jgi:spore coat polysaccharide biosynthesis predicted glycosyltransferase SpsG
MNILCYCESNHKTGFGHFSRIKILITLIKKKYPKAKLLIFSKNKKEAKEFFKTKIVYSKNIFQYIFQKKKLLDLVVLDPPYYEGKNDKILNQRLKDIYLIKDKKFKILKLTDETKPTIHYCDYLINDFPLSTNFIKKYKSTNNKMELFLGIYAFLYPKILLNKSLSGNKKYNLLIAFGGNDPNNLGIKFFETIRNNKQKKIFIFNKNTYKKLIRHQDEYNCIKPITDQKSFLKLLSSSKMYLSTPSNIMFEAFALNMSGVVIPTQNRQNVMGKSFEKMKIVKNLSLFKDLKNNILEKSLKFKSTAHKKFNLYKAINMQNKILKFL